MGLWMPRSPWIGFSRFQDLPRRALGGVLICFSNYGTDSFVDIFVMSYHVPQMSGIICHFTWHVSLVSGTPFSIIAFQNVLVFRSDLYVHLSIINTSDTSNVKVWWAWRGHFLALSQNTSHHANSSSLYQWQDSDWALHFVWYIVCPSLACILLLSTLSTLLLTLEIWLAWRPEVRKRLGSDSFPFRPN